MNTKHSWLQETTRRHFFSRCSMGLGRVALASLLTDGRLLGQARPVSTPLMAKEPHFPARVRNIIFLYMVGGPSQLDLFDDKPCRIPPPSWTIWLLSLRFPRTTSTTAPPRSSATPDPADPVGPAWAHGSAMDWGARPRICRPLWFCSPVPWDPGLVPRTGGAASFLAAIRASPSSVAETPS